MQGPFDFGGGGGGGEEEEEEEGRGGGVGEERERLGLGVRQGSHTSHLRTGVDQVCDGGAEGKRGRGRKAWAFLLSKSGSGGQKPT